MIQAGNVLSTVAAIALTLGFAAPAAAKSFGWARIDWGKGEIRIIGESAPSGSHLPLDVVGRLWVLLRDMPVSSGHTLSDHFESFDQFHDFLFRSHVAYERENCDVETLEYVFPLDGGNGLASILSPSILPPSLPDLEEVEEKREDTAQSGIGFSSIIFDLSGVAYAPVMAPRIVDESGRTIFEISGADIRDLRKRGMVGFAKSIEEAAGDPRSGPNPIVVRVVSANTPRKGDIGISLNDLAALQQSQPLGDLLKSCRILIVTD